MITTAEIWEWHFDQQHNLVGEYHRSKNPLIKNGHRAYILGAFINSISEYPNGDRVVKTNTSVFLLPGERRNITEKDHGWENKD